MSPKAESRPTMGRPSGTRLRGPSSDPNIRCHQTTTDGATPQPPFMGTALTAFLRRYEQDLVAYAEATGDRTAERMADSCAFLLIEGERLERGRHER